MWFLNIFLLIQFVCNPAGYQQMVQAGTPCMAYYSWNAPDTPQPSCPYDPSNTNPFIPY